MDDSADSAARCGRGWRIITPRIGLERGSPRWRRTAAPWFFELDPSNLASGTVSLLRSWQSEPITRTRTRGPSDSYHLLTDREQETDARTRGRDAFGCRCVDDRDAPGESHAEDQSSTTPPKSLYAVRKGIIV